jgi:Arc/MetJ family transcription regulator
VVNLTLMAKASYMMLSDAGFDAAAQEDVMRTTINLDDELFASAQEYSGLQDKSAVVRAALTALVQREAARRLARMGGSAPELVAVPRRRQDPE